MCTACVICEGLWIMLVLYERVRYRDNHFYSSNRNTVRGKDLLPGNSGEEMFGKKSQWLPPHFKATNKPRKLFRGCDFAIPFLNLWFQSSCWNKQTSTESGTRNSGGGKEWSHLCQEARQMPEFLEYDRDANNGPAQSNKQRGLLRAVQISAVCERYMMEYFPCILSV